MSQYPEVPRPALKDNMPGARVDFSQSPPEKSGGKQQDRQILESDILEMCNNLQPEKPAPYRGRQFFWKGRAINLCLAIISSVLVRG